MITQWLPDAAGLGAAVAVVGLECFDPREGRYVWSKSLVALDSLLPLPCPHGELLVVPPPELLTPLPAFHLCEGFTFFSPCEL
jgi:hypothetical protein